MLKFVEYSVVEADTPKQLTESLNILNDKIAEGDASDPYSDECSPLWGPAGPIIFANNQWLLPIKRNAF